MKQDLIVKKLNKNKDVFKHMFLSITNEQINWRPAKNKWSMLEIACHLRDEEREDFKMRINYTINKTGDEWPRIDPQGWVKTRKYAENDFKTVINEFLKERNESVKWLTSINEPDWQLSYDHPVFGSMSAGLLLANWLAHDFFHIRQINRYNYEFLDQQSDYDLSYAGAW